MTKGERIKQQRIALGISQVDLADKIGVSKQTLYKYENDIVTNIPSDKIELLAKELHVSEAYIMGWKDHFEKQQERIQMYVERLMQLSEEHREKVLSDIDYWYTREKSK